MIEAIHNIASTVAAMTAAVVGFSAIGIGGAFMIQPRTRCNPYAVFPCPCTEGDRD